MKKDFLIFILGFLCFFGGDVFAGFVAYYEPKECIKKNGLCGRGRTPIEACENLYEGETDGIDISIGTGRQWGTLTGCEDSGESLTVTSGFSCVFKFGGYWCGGRGDQDVSFLNGYYDVQVPDCDDRFDGCDTSSAVVKKSDGEPHCSAGNPIDIAEGNKYQSETIFVKPLPLVLSYNSNTAAWRHSNQLSLLISESSILSIRPDGKGLTFTENSGQWMSDNDVFYTLDAIADEGASWQLVTPTGDTEVYDAHGRILGMSSLAGNSTRFLYEGATQTVTDHLGNTLKLVSDTNSILQTATLNGEVTATFEYDDQQRLIARVSPDGNRTQYHYENTDFPKHLTGITGPDGQRFATWAYDSEGRGILSEHAGQERAELVFNADGSTTVTNALGKQTTYHFTEIEGLKRVTRVEGHATEHCVGANKAYSYYDSGLLKTKTDWGGNTTRYEYNPRGLITRIVEADSTTQARTVEQSWHPSLPLLEQRTDGTQSTRFNYDTQHRLLQTEVQRQTP